MAERLPLPEEMLFSCVVIIVTEEPDPQEVFLQEEDDTGHGIMDVDHDEWEGARSVNDEDVIDEEEDGVRADFILPVLLTIAAQGSRLGMAEVCGFAMSVSILTLCAADIYRWWPRQARATPSEDHKWYMPPPTFPVAPSYIVTQPRQ